MQWVTAGKPGELVIEFVWPNAKRTTFAQYEIHVKEVGESIEICQVNVGAQSLRRVRRLVVASE